MPRKSKATLAKEAEAKALSVAATNRLKGYPVLYMRTDGVDYFVSSIKDSSSNEGFGSLDLVGIDPRKLAIEEMNNQNDKEVCLVEYQPVALRSFKVSAEEVKE